METQMRYSCTIAEIMNESKREARLFSPANST